MVVELSLPKEDDESFVKQRAQPMVQICTTNRTHVIIIIITIFRRLSGNNNINQTFVRHSTRKREEIFAPFRRSLWKMKRIWKKCILRPQCHPSIHYGFGEAHLIQIEQFLLLLPRSPHLRYRSQLEHLRREKWIWAWHMEVCGCFGLGLENSKFAHFHWSWKVKPQIRVPRIWNDAPLFRQGWMTNLQPPEIIFPFKWFSPSIPRFEQQCWLKLTKVEQGLFFWKYH